MTVRVTREAEPQIELYGAYSGELVGEGKKTLTFTPTGTYLTMVVKNSLSKVQVEQGGFPSSYIPTTGAAATRSADVALIPTSAFGFNSEAMTVVVDCSMSFDGTNYPRVWEIGSSINNHDRINVYIKADGGNYGVGLQTANVSQGSFTLSTGNSVPTAQVKIAYALREDDIAAVQDGGVVQTNGSGTLKGGNPRTLLALGGSTAYAADYMNGHIKSIQYYPRRLTNAQLQELTT